MDVPLSLTLGVQTAFEDMTRARAVYGGTELPLIPLSPVDGTESRPMVGIASTASIKIARTYRLVFILSAGRHIA
jgi:hypothetical protein